MTDDMEAAKGTTPAAAVGEASLVGRVWNAIGAFGRRAVLSVSGAAAGGIIGNAAYAFFLENYTKIIAFLNAFQTGGAQWFKWAMETLKFWAG